MCAGLRDHFPALFEVEESLGLLGITDGRNDDLVKDARGPLDDFKMAVVKRVKGPGYQTNRHDASSPSATNTVTSVVPYRFSFWTVQPAGAEAKRSFSIIAIWALVPPSRASTSRGP